jgi:hypothetical protein
LGWAWGDRQYSVGFAGEAGEAKLNASLHFSPCSRQLASTKKFQNLRSIGATGARTEKLTNAPCPQGLSPRIAKCVSPDRNKTGIMPPTKYLKFVCCNYLLIDLIKLIVYEKM